VKEIMNMKKLNVALAILVTAVMAGNSQTVNSDIVGYQTVTIAGGGTAAAPKYTMLAVNLANSTVYQGTMGRDLSGAFTAGSYNAGTYAKYYLEIVSTGARADIVSNTGSNLVLGTADQSSISAALGTPQIVRIRKHRTLSDLFGGASGTASDSTVSFQKGATASAADNVLIMIDGVYKTLYYSSSATKPGWRDSAGNVATDFPIYPSDGMFVARKATAPLSITILGEVKNYTSLIPIAAGVSTANPKYTLTGLPVPVAVTLPTLFGGDGTAAGGASLKLAKGATASAADNVLVWNGSSFATYFYSSSATKPGWRDSAGNVASAVSLPSDAAFLIKRTSAASTVSYTANF
jgi:hypothetical protein